MLAIGRVYLFIFVKASSCEVPFFSLIQYTYSTYSIFSIPMVYDLQCVEGSLSQDPSTEEPLDSCVILSHLGYDQCPHVTTCWVPSLVLIWYVSHVMVNCLCT